MNVGNLGGLDLDLKSLSCFAHSRKANAVVMLLLNSNFQFSDVRDPRFFLQGLLSMDMSSIKESLRLPFLSPHSSTSRDRMRDLGDDAGSNITISTPICWADFIGRRDRPLHLAQKFAIYVTCRYSPQIRDTGCWVDPKQNSEDPKKFILHRMLVFSQLSECFPTNKSIVTKSYSKKTVTILPEDLRPCILYVLPIAVAHD